MKKAFIKLYVYEDRQKVEGMLLAYALERKAPVLVDLYHGERMPNEIRSSFLDRKTRVYMLPQGRELDAIIQSFHLKNCNASIIDLYRRLKWLRMPFDPLTAPEKMGLDPLPCSYMEKCLQRFRTPDALLERRILPDEYPVMWRQIKEYLRRAIKAEQEIVRQMKEIKQNFPYGDIQLQMGGEVRASVSLYQLKKCVRLTEKSKDGLYWEYQKWADMESPKSFQQYIKFLKEGYRLVRCIEDSPHLIKNILKEYKILEYGKHYEGKVDLPGKLLELASVPLGMQMVLADYGQALSQIVLRWAGERREKVRKDEYPLVFGNGVAGCLRHGVSVAKWGDIKKKIDEWRLCHSGLTSFWEETLRIFWYSCHTHKSVGTKAFYLSWECSALVVTLSSGRKLYFRNAKLICEKKQWMLRVTEPRDGKTSVTKQHFMPDILELLAEAVVEEIVLEHAAMLRKMGACVVCTSRRKILFFMSEGDVQMQDRGLLKRVLCSKEQKIAPIISYGGGHSNAGYSRRMGK